MRTLIQLIARLAFILYALAATGIFFAIRGLVQARKARRLALFGLEREAALQKRRQSISTILSLILLSGFVYIIQTIVAPNLGQRESPPTPTPVVFITQQSTETPSRLLYPTITPTPGLPPADVGAELTPAPGEAVNGCEILGSNITSPASGQVVSGQVVVEGQANILDFAQYKFEIRGPSTGGAWIVVATFTTPVPEGFLGTWDSTSLPPGDYVLRLVVLRTDGTFPTPCEVPINVAASGGPSP